MKIPGFVIFAHGLILTALICLQPHQPTPSHPTRISVHTYVIREKKSKSSSKVQCINTTKRVANQTLSHNSRNKKLTQMVQQSLYSLEGIEEGSKLKPLQPIPTLESASICFYQDKLISFLQNALTLPERGDVKIVLRINRQGVVEAVQIKETTSESNRLYIQGTLPTLLLPPFENNFREENVHTFSITLTSS